jgi:hypothetical protein
MCGDRGAKLTVDMLRQGFDEARERSGSEAIARARAH